jgi:hypothetical protein
VADFASDTFVTDETFEGDVATDFNYQNDNFSVGAPMEEDSLVAEAKSSIPR